MRDKNSGIDLSAEKLCPFSERGTPCDDWAAEVEMYYAYLADLAKRASTDIFSNGPSRPIHQCLRCAVYAKTMGNER